MNDWRKYYPWLNSVNQKIFSDISTLWVLGSYKAPGTWGSVAGAILTAVFFCNMPLVSYAVLCAILVYFAIGICDIGEKYFNEKDPSKINFDEFVAMPICYFGIFCAPAVQGMKGIFLLLLGFGLFRFFDIFKPLGIYKIQKLEGGLGCVMDDILAAVYTCVILNMIKFLLM